MKVVIPSNNYVEIAVMKSLSFCVPKSDKELYDDVVLFFGLTKEDMEVLCKSQNDIIYKNRIRWAKDKVLDERLATKLTDSSIVVTKKGKRRCDFYKKQPCMSWFTKIVWHKRD